MGLLRCKLFTTPTEVPELERCLVSDADHITPGSRGEHVRRIQVALNRLSQGPSRENFDLDPDGVYGPDTAPAVAACKNAPSRRILQPWQTTADDIVGKRTIKSLDDEMDILENQSDGSDRYVSTTQAGAPHDHSKCPGGAYGGADHRVEHKGTPVNPKGPGRKINIYGENETKYLGFEDYATERQHADGRPLTSDPPPPRGRGLPDGCASDICIRSSPISDVTKNEIKRIARPFINGGCRFTYAGNAPRVMEQWPFFVRLGAIVEHIVIFAPDDQPDQPGGEPGNQNMHAVVVEIRKLLTLDGPLFL
jgi:peptidoglycan hydrolase-like protein with peptidoglycan-binding domain